LGDVVGYGPNPLECTQMVMEHCDVCLKGNHDEALVEGVYLFNPVAKNALEWSREVFLNTSHPSKSEMWEFLQNLPLIYCLDNYMFVHGSPLDPTSDYILSRNIAIEERKFQEIFQTFDSILFSGHTHMPCVITDSLEVFSLEQLGYKYHRDKQKAIINVGAVGQPRDEDPRACYLEAIDDMFFFHRVVYDKEAVCKKIIENPHLDKILGQRLLVGK
jgi:diadenosine tetraphosphatase ApaH/serine/threonine PP2A family protein phosphatase